MSDTKPDGPEQIRSRPDYVHKKLTRAEYLEWLNSFLSIINEFTTDAQKEKDAREISFLRVAEHVFNYCIDRSSHYEYLVDQVNLAASHLDLSELTSFDLKCGRDRVAHKLAKCIIDHPAIRERHQQLCDNLKEPVILGCML